MTAAPAHRHPSREPLVWLVFGIPLLTIVAGLVTLWIALQRADSNVTEDYYKDGLAVNRMLARDEQARAYGLSGLLTVASDGKAGGEALGLDLAMTGSQDAFEPQVTLRMTHPVQQALDRQVLLQGIGAGRYVGQVKDGGAAGTRWILALEAPGWRLALPGVIGLAAGTRITVDAGAPKP